MSIDTVTLQCFLAVADTASFTKAAERVGRTQSAISQQIAKLENLVGKPLFNRGKEFSLTTEGEIFLGYAKQMYLLHRESLDRFKEPDLHGEIRLGLPEDFASVILSDVLVDFSRLHPRILLNVECDLTINILDGFKAGKFDLILIKTTPPKSFIDQTTLWKEPVKWIGKPELLPLIDQNTVIPLVLSPKPCVYRETAINALEKSGIKWRLAYTSPSYAGKMAAVKAGLGITIIQETLIPDYLKQLENKTLPTLGDIPISLLKKQNSNKAIESLEYFLLKKLR
jgi:DNA-binding transcriptional LysR family regulator